MATVNGLPKVPDKIKLNVRSVLISKAGGVLVSDFIKDYKALVKESLFIKDLGFDNMSEFIKALPDVARLEYDDKCMAHRLYGVGDPNTYMSLAAKNAQNPKSQNRDRGRNRGGSSGGGGGSSGSGGGGGGCKSDGDDQYSEFLPNAKGLFTLCYPRRNKEETEDDIRDKFSVICDLDDVNMIERMVFIRFKSKENALKTLDEFKSIGIRIADEKGNKNKNRSPQDNVKSERSPPQDKQENKWKNDRGDRTDQKRDGGSKRTDSMNVYLGNLNQDATQEDIEGLVAEFSPMEVRMKKVASDPRKVFAFVEFSSAEESKADEMIEKLNNQVWMGRKLLVRLAHENREKREAASSTGNSNSNSAPVKKPSKPNWGQSSSSSSNHNSNARNNAVSSLDDDEWDNDTEDTPSTQPAVTVKVTSDETKKTSGSIWATPNTSDKTGASSPLKSPILDQSYTQSAVKQSYSPVKTGPQITSAYGQSQPVTSRTFTRSPVKTEQDLLVESMTSFLKSPEKPQGQPEIHRNMQAPSMTDETQYVRSPVRTDTGMQITIQQSPHKRNLNNAFAQLEVSGNQQRLSPNTHETSVKLCNGSSAPPEDDFDDMPVLEPSVGDPMPPLEPSVKKSAKVFVSNFPYGSHDEELYSLFYDYGVVDISVKNRNMTSKSTTAVITLQSPEMAELAIANLNQTQYMGRRLLVMVAKSIEEVKRDSQAYQSYDQGYGSEQQRGYDRYHHQQNYPPQRGYNGYSGRYGERERYPNEEYGRGMVASTPNGSYTDIKSPLLASPTSSTSSLSENRVAFKSWYSMLQTFKIVMTKLGGRVRDIRYKPQERLTVFVTSIFDEQNFWGQVIEDSTTLANLENVMQALQLEETRTGPTKGLGRCAAKFDDEWYRGWIIAEKGFNLTVFYVDYGNIATIPKNSTKLTCPDLWEHKPALRPFKLTEGSAIDLKKLESQLVTLQVVKTGIEDTGYLMEVIVTSQ